MVMSADAWTGRWVGVEGLVLEVAPAETPRYYRLKITLMDGTKNYEGVASSAGIRFMRNGRTETLHAVTGDQTGLKYLAGKKNCLMIRAAEGFCRD